MNNIDSFISGISLQTYTNDIIKDINVTFWHRANIYFTCIKSLLLLLYQNQHSLFQDITPNIKCMTNHATITRIWHRATCYFTYISNTLFLITVPNTNNINLFFSEISQAYHMYDKVPIITQIWHKTNCYFTIMSNACYLITIPNMNKIKDILL